MNPFSLPVLVSTSRRIFFAIGGVLLAAFLATGYVVFYGGNDFGGEDQKEFFVRRGASFAQIVDSLEQAGIIRNHWMFKLVGRVYGGTDRMQVGRYRFTNGASNTEIFLTLRDGKGNELIRVTIPEGSRSRLQARIFSRAIGIDSVRYMNLVNDPAVAREFGIEAASLEGYLLPETYSLHWGIDEKELVELQMRDFKTFFTDSLMQRAQELGWNVHQVMTFASIVEGEAILDGERPVIAGVYRNRLRIGMRLEADPTIQYLFGDRPRRVLYSDLRIENPYNTYMYAGLPPGPVNNPGKASVLASLYPAEHTYLFFVANGRRGHWFASTYDEHVRNVRRYRHERARQWREAKGPTGG